MRAMIDASNGTAIAKSAFDDDDAPGDAIAQPPPSSPAVAAWTHAPLSQENPGAHCSDWVQRS